MNYTIAACPTTYRGRRYRSRLEARWAAFFDALGWNHEYEPCDLGRWSPDFALWGRRRDFPILVEVKPIRAWDRETARKMADAADPHGNCLLLVGSEPDCDDAGWTMIGWFGEPDQYEARWTEALLGADSLGRFDMRPNGGEFCPETLLWEMPEQLSPRAVSAAWKSAANAVQWRPK